MTRRVVISVAILLAMATLSAAGAVAIPSRTAADQTLMKYMMRTKFSNDPQVAVACFGYYLPILSEISNEFSSAFQKCSADEQERIIKLNDAAIKDRYQIELAADSVCVRLDACNDQIKSLDYFDCVSEQGSDNTRTLYTVTQNATEKGVDLRERYRVIQVDTYRCQNASERAYVENTAITYKQLDLCLKTGNLPSTTTPEITTPITDTTKKEDDTTVVDSSTTTDNSNSSTSTESSSSSSTDNNSSSTDDPNSSSTLATTEGPSTTPSANEPPEALPTGRGMKILSELRKFWRTS